MELVDDDAGTQVAESIGGARDLCDTRQERQHATLRFTERTADGRGDGVLDAAFGGAADVAQVERVTPPFALDHRHVSQQRREARAVERRRHRQQPQVGSQRALCVERQRQSEIAVEMPLMHFVEQHGRYAGKFGIGLDAVYEDPLGQHRHSRCRRALAVHSRGIAIGPPNRLAGHGRHPLRRRPRR